MNKKTGKATKATASRSIPTKKQVGKSSTTTAARKQSNTATGKSITTATSNAQSNTEEYLNLVEIKQLIELIADRQFTEFELARGEFRLRLGRGTPATSAAAVMQTAHPVAFPVANVPAVVPTVTNFAAQALANEQRTQATPVAETALPLETIAAETGLHRITSPLVGTFYRAGSPTAEPFVKEGDVIATGKVLCIVEAMKLMNEIHADVSGTVVKVLVENGQPVEYGQPLFEVKL